MILLMSVIYEPFYQSYVLICIIFYIIIYNDNYHYRDNYVPFLQYHILNKRFEI